LHPYFASVELSWLETTETTHFYYLSDQASGTDTNSNVTWQQNNMRELAFKWHYVSVDLL
jgi:hypothetical protein